MVDKLVLCKTPRIREKMPQLVYDFLEEQRPDYLHVDFSREQAGIYEFPLPEAVRYVRGMHPSADHETLAWYLNLKRLTYAVMKEYRDSHDAQIFYDCRFRDAILTQKLAWDTDDWLFRQPLHRALKWAAAEITPKTRPELVPEFLIRDAAVENDVRSLEGKVAVFAGPTRISGDYHNLTKRFADLKPEVHELVDVALRADVRDYT